MLENLVRTERPGVYHDPVDRSVEAKVAVGRIVFLVRELRADHETAARIPDETDGIGRGGDKVPIDAELQLGRVPGRDHMVPGFEAERTAAVDGDRLPRVVRNDHPEHVVSPELQAV